MLADMKVLGKFYHEFFIVEDAFCVCHVNRIKSVKFFHPVTAVRTVR